jgi:predicted transcriptional regulator
MKRVLWYLIAGSRGGANRARIIEAIHDRPYNVNQLSKELNLDYKTVQHHIKILGDHKVINSGEETYGAMFFLTDRMDENYPTFLEILSKMKK